MGDMKSYTSCILLKMMSLLLTVTMQVFITQKRTNNILKLDSKSSNLSIDPFKNIDFSDFTSN